MIKEHTITELKEKSLEEIEEHHNELWEYIKKVSAIRDYKRIFKSEE